MTLAPKTVQRIRLFGQEYLLLGGAGRNGAIATESAYVHGRDSFAYYYADRDAIMRYGSQIGTSADFEVLGEVPLPSPAPDALENLFGGVA